MSESKNHVYDLVYIALGAVILAVCAWITVPVLEVPYTLQTMGVFLICALLGGKRGTIAVVIYILLGAVGIPVFSGMKGGLGVLMGVTGGYIVGFIFSGLVYWLVEKLMGKSLPAMIIGMVLGLLACYLFGSLWFYFVYTNGTGAIGMGTVLMKCVVPFIIPDLVKITVAVVLAGMLSKVIHLKN